MALEIGYRGEEMNLTIRQGATFGPYHATMKNADLTPVDLTDCIIRGHIRKKPRDDAIVSTLAVVIDDAVSGKYTFLINAIDTALIPAGDTVEATGSKYFWDMELQYPSGRVFPLYYGNVTVLREVTRA